MPEDYELSAKLNMLDRAWIACIVGHGAIGQTRSNGEPYSNHPIEVATICENYGGSTLAKCVALCHDLLEDTDLTRDVLAIQVHPSVADGVKELTNIYTKENFPHMDKHTRETQENARIAEISDGAKFVKLCDIMHNISDLDKMPEEWATKYLCSKGRQVEAALRPDKLDCPDRREYNLLYSDVCAKVREMAYKLGV